MKLDELKKITSNDIALGSMIRELKNYIIIPDNSLDTSVNDISQLIDLAETTENTYLRDRLKLIKKNIEIWLK